MESAARSELFAQITAYLARQQNLVASYLFGSLAEETDHQMSDIDVALLLPQDTDPETALEIRLQVMGDLEQLCRRPVDVVILNHAPPLLRFQIIQRGQVLVVRDDEARCLFQARTMCEYYDTQRYLDYQFSQLIGRIREEGLGAGYQGHGSALEKARRLSKRLAALSENKP